ncbi:MAG: ATP synthase F1 subunit gamma [Rhodothermia bacterium]|nr:MAG: ATP synthase F1 subunit gamma [Rhodothermia bacterium]
MASLRDIRDRIASVKNTQQVTRAMKMVAAAKLRRAQENIFKTRPYAYKIGEITGHLKSQLDPLSHPLFYPRDETNAVLLVVVTADRGLAGAFNSNIIKLTEQTIQERYQSHQDAGTLHLLCVGRKGHEYFEKREYSLVGDFRGVFGHLTFDTAQQVSRLAREGFEEKKWDDVQIIYNEFRNTISQNRIVEPFLPIPSEQFMTPVMETEIGHQAELKEGSAVDYIFEPDARSTLDTLIPLYLGYEFWRALLESNAAEQGARMVAMDSATTNADEMLNDLKLTYNRARQDAITKELIEITSGADALASA